MVIILGVLFLAISFALWNWTMLSEIECLTIAVLILLVLFVIIALIPDKKDNKRDD